MRRSTTLATGSPRIIAEPFDRPNVGRALVAVRSMRLAPAQLEPPARHILQFGGTVHELHESCWQRRCATDRPSLPAHRGSMDRSVTHGSGVAPRRHERSRSAATSFSRASLRPRAGPRCGGAELGEHQLRELRRLASVLATRPLPSVTPAGRHGETGLVTHHRLPACARTSRPGERRAGVERMGAHADEAAYVTGVFLSPISARGGGVYIVTGVFHLPRLHRG